MRRPLCESSTPALSADAGTACDAELLIPRAAVIPPMQEHGSSEGGSLEASSIQLVADDQARECYGDRARYARDHIVAGGSDATEFSWHHSGAADVSGATVLDRPNPYRATPGKICFHKLKTSEALGHPCEA